MNVSRWIKSLWLMGVMLACGFSGPTAWGVLNNGFETDWLYTSIAWWGDETDPTRGDLIAYDEQTGAVMATLGNFEKWESLTFYGTSANDDARLFVARRATGSVSTDITIAELNSSGGTIKSVLLRSLNNAPSTIGPQLYVGSLRFSSFHGTLFLSLCTDEADPGTALVYEVDLALTSVLNTYTGPGISNPPRISIDKNNGKLYMAGTFLIAGQNGYLIAFDTSAGSTSSYTMLIDGDTYKPGDSGWNNPACPIYRGSNHPENNRPTIMVMNMGTSGATNYPVMEFYLDETDANGNLVKRQNAYWARRSQWQGQVDEYTGSIISVRQFHSDSYDTGIDQYTVNDVHYRPARNDPITDVFLKRGCVDVASPGVAAAGSPGGSRIVNLNPRYTETFPGTSGFEDYPLIQALSYHIHTIGEVNTCLGNTGYGKPIILSDDGYAAFDVPEVLSFITATANAGEHYEHWDAHLGEAPPAGGGCMQCLVIDGQEDFPADSLTIMNALGTHASTLTPGGTLTRQGREFYWNGQQVTLMGSGWMGALIGQNFEIEGYLDVLQSHGNNLLRVWAVEQWTGTCMGNDVNNGIIPYVGAYGSWDLDQQNNAFFIRAKQFVQAAWDRGIVVQLSIFDRCGLVNKPDPGVFGDSPYNRNNNVNGFLDVPGLNQYPAFTGLDGTNIGTVNRAFIERLVHELQDYGNVIYEIMNEPHHYWTNQTEWHQWVADIVDGAFNDVVGINVSVDLGSPDVENGMANIQVADGDTTPVSIGGRSCKTNVDPATDHYFYFGIDHPYNGSEPEAYITVQYYDTGSGSLVLHYDSTDPAPPPDNYYKNGGGVTLTGSNTWKEHTYHVTDAYFGDRQNEGADFRIAQTESGPMYLDVVTVVDRLPPTITQHPASLSLHKNNPAQFTVSAGGEGPFQYQWQFNEATLFDGDGISGTKTNTLQIDRVQFAHQGNYRCVVSNLAGDAISDNASLTMTVLGDFDVDTDVDQEDFGHLQACRTELLVPQQDPACIDALLNDDEFVSMTDVNIFLGCMSGANIPADPSCMP
ncbi:MAG: immunoglobulin domain-containing protein [Planctomycetota bacterium]|nr:MAG: immunoglobulin domain-containing protein [Planctomycetota bacterium]